MATDFSREGGALGAALNPIVSKSRGAANGSVQFDMVSAETGIAALTTLSQDGGADPLRQSLNENDVIRTASDIFYRWDASVKLQLLSSEIGTALHDVEKSSRRKAILEEAEKYVDKLRKVKLPLIEQAQAVARLKSLRGERESEILAQKADFWNVWTATSNINPEICPSLTLLLQAISSAATALVMKLKADIAMPRPVDVIPGICPIIQTPGHGSFPSGHSTIAHLESLLLCAFTSGAFNSTIEDRRNNLKVSLREWKQSLLWRRADRIAKNREVAGVHYSSDSKAGEDLAGIIFEALFFAIGDRKYAFVNLVLEDALKEVRQVSWKV